MNPLLSPTQLQGTFIKKSYAFFYKTINQLKHNSMLNKDDKEILTILTSYASPQTIANPQINYWCYKILEDLKNESYKNHLFFEITLLLLELDYPSLTYSTSTQVDSPLIQEPIPKGTHIIEKQNNKLILSNNLEIELSPKTNQFHLGRFYLDNKDAYQTTFSIDENHFTSFKYANQTIKQTISLLVKTLIVLEKQDEDQRSFSHPQLLGTICVSEEESLIFCDSIIHEAMHLEFELISFVYPLLENDNEEKYYSSVTPRPRPLFKCLLALHAFVNLEQYYLNAHIDNSHGTLALSRFLKHYFKNEELIKTIGKYGRFTPEGKLLFEFLKQTHEENGEFLPQIQKSYKELIEKYKQEAKDHKEQALKDFPDILC